MGWSSLDLAILSIGVLGLGTLIDRIVDFGGVKPMTAVPVRLGRDEVIPAGLLTGR